MTGRFGASETSLPSSGRLSDRRHAFLVGAPRCGTTALAKALDRHARIRLAKPKEPHFFVRSDLDWSRVDLETDFFGVHFPREEAAQAEVLVDGSVSYLYSAEALERICDRLPEARFIAMVRNPIDMIHSYHARLVYLLDEDETDFWRAWDLQDRRSQGLDLPRRCRAPHLLQYREIGLLGLHLERLFEQVGRERCHVIVFDDLCADGRKTFRDAAHFLGVEDDERIEVRARNESRGFKSRWLQQFIANPPALVARFIQSQAGWNPKTMAFVRPLRRRIKKRNTFKQERRSLPDDERLRLRAVFAEDIARLEKLLQRDFSHWG